MKTFPKKKNILGLPFYQFTLWPEFSTPWVPADGTDRTNHRPTLPLTDWFDQGANSVSYILTNCVCQISMPCTCMLQLVFCEIIMFDIFYKLDFNIFQLNMDFYASIQIWNVRCCTFMADENIFFIPYCWTDMSNLIRAGLNVTLGECAAHN